MIFRPKHVHFVHKRIDGMRHVIWDQARFPVGCASDRAVVFVLLERGCAWDAAFASCLPRFGGAVLVDLDVLDSLPRVGDLHSDYKGAV